MNKAAQRLPSRAWRARRERLRLPASPNAGEIVEKRAESGSQGAIAGHPAP